jgi:tripartite-type tricarboxylate transporter receptor subunit TctC
MLTRRSLLAATGALALPAAGQSWPTRPVVFVVPSQPGGSLDILTRILANGVKDMLGQPVITENRGGAGGAIGADYVAKSPPDSNRFLLGAVHHAILPAAQRLPYDSEADLVPVTDIATSPNALIVPPSLGVRDMAGLLAWVRAQPPGAVNYATGGNGTLHHLTGVMFAAAVGVPMTAVHYRGSAPAVADLLAGRVAFMFETMPSAAAQIRAGAVRAIAVTTAQRAEGFADVPTMAEAGFPGIAVETWYGLFGPRGTPPEVAQRLRDAAAATLATPALREGWAQNGVFGGGRPVEQFAAFWRAELVRWAALAQQAGITRE